MTNQTIRFDGKCALMYYGLVLQRCVISSAKRKQKWLDVPAMDGSLDLMEAAGMVAYEKRTLTAEFKTCGSIGYTAESLISDLEGKRVRIDLPGPSPMFMMGVVHVSGAYLPGTQIIVTAVCEPWRYSGYETIQRITAGETLRECRWLNRGAKPAVPHLTVGQGGAEIVMDGNVMIFPEGAQYAPDLEIPPGGMIRFTATGAEVTARYREAFL